MKEPELYHPEKLNTLLESIKELFFEFGLKNLNMEEISRKLGISKKTLYGYVKSKEDLIEKIFEYEEAQWIKRAEELGLHKLNAIEQLFNISLMAYEEMKRFNPMIRFELQKYYEPVFHAHLERKRKYIYQGMKRNMEQGIKEKLYRIDVNTEIVATIYLNSFIEMHNSEVCKLMDVDFLKVFEVMFENHIRAISTPEGIALFETQKNKIEEYIKIN